MVSAEQKEGGGGVISARDNGVKPGFYVTAYTNSKGVFFVVKSLPDVVNQVFGLGYYQIDTEKAPVYDGYYDGNDLYVYNTKDYPVLPDPSKRCITKA